MTFLVCGTPRSRTTWISRFLSYGNTCCLHEPSLRFQSLDDLDRLLALPDTGISDSAMTLLWRHVLARQPLTKFAVIRRPLEEVIASAARLGLHGAGIAAGLDKIVAAADRISALPGTLTLAYDALDEAGCAALFRHCLGFQMPRAWWRYWSPVHVDCDVGEQLRQMQLNVDGIRRVYGPYLT